MQSILWNMMNVKKYQGDAFSQIIRNDKETWINLKPLDTGSMKTITINGVIDRYEQISKIKDKPNQKFKPREILHFVNDRIEDEIHGTSMSEAVEWIILARNEAMRDWRRLSHRSTIRVMYIDTEDTTKLASVKTEYN